MKLEKVYLSETDEIGPPITLCDKCLCHEICAVWCDHVNSLVDSMEKSNVAMMTTMNPSKVSEMRGIPRIKLGFMHCDYFKDKSLFKEKSDE